MSQSNYEAWVYFQENPLEEALRPHGSPRLHGGFGANAFVKQWEDKKRAEQEAEVVRKEDEFLKKHNAG